MSTAPEGIALGRLELFRAAVSRASELIDEGRTMLLLEQLGLSGDDLQVFATWIGEQERQYGLDHGQTWCSGFLTGLAMGMQ